MGGWVWLRLKPCHPRPLPHHTAPWGCQGPSARPSHWQALLAPAGLPFSCLLGFIDICLLLPTQDFQNLPILSFLQAFIRPDIVLQAPTLTNSIDAVDCCHQHMSRALLLHLCWTYKVCFAVAFFDSVRAASAFINPFL